MKVSSIKRLTSKYPECDISTKNENFFVKCGNEYILIHNSPAIFAGIDPETGKFFVGTKSVFNKNPKLNFSHDDINRNHEGGLAKKLHLALDNLSKLGINGVLQGDMMYDRDDLRKEVIDGEEVITFQPNTIAYAVPTNTDLAKRIVNSKIGVIFHTTYNGGPTLQDMSASFGVDISSLNKTPDVWFDDATYKDVSGTATLTAEETKLLKSIMSKASKINDKNGKDFDAVSQNKDITSLLKIFNNSIVRQGKSVEDPVEHIKSFIDYVIERGKAALDKIQPTSPKAIEAKKEKEKAFINSVKEIQSLFKPLVNMTQMMSLLIKAKNIIIKKLQQGKQLTKNFIKTDDGYKPTDPEGFVAIDHQGNAVKLVDRLEFSMQNFNAAKNWSKGAEEEQVAKESQFFETDNEVEVPERKTEGLTPVIFIVGRYQGFQKGHDSLVQEAKKYLSKVGANKIAIGVVAGEGTTGDAKNPMTGEERIKFLNSIYKSDPQVVIVPEPFAMGHITKVIEPLARNGMYIKGLFGGSDRASYVSDVEKLNEKPNWQRDASGNLGFLPVDSKEDGSIDITPIIVDRDDSGEGSVGGNVEAFEKPESLASSKRTKKGKFYSDNPEALDKIKTAQQQLYNKIISTPESILPKEMLSGSLVRNLIKNWNIPFNAWYKEIVPPLYNNPESKKAYKKLYDKLVTAMKVSNKVEEIAAIRNGLRENLGIGGLSERVDNSTFNDLSSRINMYKKLKDEGNPKAKKLENNIEEFIKQEPEAVEAIKSGKKFDEYEKDLDGGNNENPKESNGEVNVGFDPSKIFSNPIMSISTEEEKKLAIQTAKQYKETSDILTNSIKQNEGQFNDTIKSLAQIMILIVNTIVNSIKTNQKQVNVTGPAKQLENKLSEVNKDPQLADEMVDLFSKLNIPKVFKQPFLHALEQNKTLQKIGKISSLIAKGVFGTLWASVASKYPAVGMLVGGSIILTKTALEGFLKKPITKENIAELNKATEEFRSLIRQQRSKLKEAKNSIENGMDVDIQKYRDLYLANKKKGEESELENFMKRLTKGGK